MEKETISIIVPIYNAQKYLERCLQSIVRQTYVNLQIILVNDGSTDESGKMCDAYAKKDARIKVIHKQNAGVGEARNTGLDAVQGDYIYFIDSDDSMALDTLRIMRECLIKYKVDLVIGDMQLFYDDDVPTDNTSGTVKGEILNTEQLLLQPYRFHEMDKVVAIWNKLYKKKVFNGVRFPVGATGRLYEDTAVMYKLMSSIERAAILDKVFYYYFQTPNSITRKDFSLDYLSLIPILKENVKYYRDMGFERVADVAEVNLINDYIQFYTSLWDSNIPDKAKYCQIYRKEIRKRSLKVFCSRYVALRAKIMTLLICIHPGVLNFYRKSHAVLRQRLLGRH